MIGYTVIIPVYNLSQWVADCVRSVFDAGRSANVTVECIVVDDGSSDGSGELIDGLGQRFCSESFVLRTLHHKRNLGVAAARNSALEIAQGTWICFVDGDDVLPANSFQIRERCIHAYPEADVLQFGIIYVDGQENGKRYTAQADTSDMTIINNRSLILEGYGGKSFVTYAYRRSKMGHVRFQPFVMGEDRLFLVSCLACAEVKVMTNAVGYVCRRRQGSAFRSSMTMSKLHSSCAYRKEIMNVIHQSGVPVSLIVRRRLLSGAVEGTAGEVMQLEPSQRTAGWKEWFHSLSLIPDYAITSLWFRIVIFFLRHCHSSFCARLLCVLPLRLKKLGLRRNH